MNKLCVVIIIVAFAATAEAFFWVKSPSESMFFDVGEPDMIAKDDISHTFVTERHDGALYITSGFSKIFLERLDAESDSGKCDLYEVIYPLSPTM